MMGWDGMILQKPPVPIQFNFEEQIVQGHQIKGESCFGIKLDVIFIVLAIISTGYHRYKEIKKGKIVLFFLTIEMSCYQVSALSLVQYYY